MGKHMPMVVDVEIGTAKGARAYFTGGGGRLVNISLSDDLNYQGIVLGIREAERLHRFLDMLLYGDEGYTVDEICRSVGAI